MRTIDADKVIEKLKEHKSLFCKNRVEFRALSDKDKAKVDEIDTCIAELVNAEGVQTTDTDSDTISRQAAIETVMECYDNSELFEVYEKKLRELPPAQPEHTCVNCGRTANNGGWYADGGTRCPIEEHYALPKDGYCHLWEKRNVTDDDYTERREE